MCFAPATPCLASSNLASVSSDAYARVIRTINPHVAEEQSLAYADALLSNARKMHVDPRLVMAVVTVESHWDARAISIHGAEGLGQLKPGTAHELGVDPWSGRGNLRGITIYLHRLLSLFKSSRQSMREAIAGYNAGPYAVKSYGGIPPRRETQRYVVKVIAAWKNLKTRLSANPSALSVAALLAPERAVQKNDAAYWGVQ